MKQLTTIFALGIVGLMIIIYFDNRETVSVATTHVAAATVQFVQILLWSLLVIIVAAACIVAYVVIDKRRDVRLRQIDGSFALMEYKRGNVTVVVDPNKMIAGAGAYHPEVGWRELEPAAGWDKASMMSAAVQMTRTAQAIAPGDSAVSSLDTYRPPTIPAAAVNPRANATMLRAEMSPPPPTIEAPRLPAPPIEAQELIRDDQPTKLALGQDVESGAAAFWTLPHHPHIRIHGSTQSGKTALARFLVTQAIRQGYEVVIYDRRRGKDWGIFDGKAQLIDVRNTSTFIRHMQNEVRRYEERDALLGQNNASNLEVLARKTGQSYRRRLIVVEELGVQYINARESSREEYNALAGAMARLTSEAGATGIHGMYIDQMPSMWEKRIRYNCAGVIFHLPDHGGKVAGYQMAHELPQYHCWFDDRIIRTGFMEESQINATLSGVRSFGEEIGVDEPVFDANEPNERTNEPTNPMSAAEIKDAIFAHLERKPDATQSEIRAALGSSKSWTNTCWHEWHNRPIDEDEAE